MRPLPILGFVIALTAGLAQPATAACRIQTLAELPISSGDGVPVMHAQINGVPANLVFSTAPVSALNPGAAAKFHLAKGAVPPGWQTRPALPVARAETLDLGDGRFADVSFFVTVKPIDDTGEIDGVVGQNVIGDYDIEYDLAHGMIRLFAPDPACRNVMLAYWARSGFSELALSRPGDAPRTTRFAATVNGTQVLAALSSARLETTLNAETARQMGVVTSAKPQDDAADGKSTPARSAVVDLRVGKEEMAGASVRVLELRGLGLELGADFLRSHRVFVANSQEKIYFTPNREASPSEAAPGGRKP